MGNEMLVSGGADETLTRWFLSASGKEHGTLSPSGVPDYWRAGMRLEAWDRKTPSLVCVATVGKEKVQFYMSSLHDKNISRNTQ